MKPIALCCLVMIPVHQLKADEWIGLSDESQWIAGIQYIAEQGDQHSTLVYLSRHSEPVSIDLQYSESLLSDSYNSFENNSFNGGLRGSINDVMEFTAAYSFQGQKQQLEIDSYSMQLAYNPFPFFSSLEYSGGNLSIHTREELTNRRIPEVVKSDMDVTTLILGWWFDDFSLSASYQQADYERHLSALHTRPLIQYIIKPSALAQTGLLIDHQTSFKLTIPVNEDQFSLQFSSTISAVDKSETRIWQSDWFHVLDSNVSLLLSVSRSDNEVSSWSVGAGLEWYN